MSIIRFFIGHFTIGFFLAFLARVSFLLFQWSHIGTVSWVDWVWVHLVALKLDIATFSYLFIPAFVLYLVVSYQKLKTVLRVFYSVFAFFYLLVNCIDMELFAHWGSRVNLMALFYAQYAEGAKASLDIVDLLILAAWYMVFLIPFIWLLPKFLNYFVKPFTWYKSTVLGIVGLLALSFLGIRGGVGKVPINQSSVVFSENQVMNVAAVNPVWNLLYFVFNKGANLSYDNFKYYDDLDERLNSLKLFDSAQSMSPKLFNHDKPNIVLLMMESLSAETMQSMGGAFDWSKGLDSLTQEAMWFSQVYASGNRTDKGLVALLSGFPAQSAASILTDPNRVNQLPFVGCKLKNEGYTTLFMYGGDADFANMAYYLRKGCFTAIVDKSKFQSKTALGNWGYHDQDLFANLKMVLSEQYQSPFFVTALSLSVHEPFDIPKKFDRSMKYEMAYKYADSCLFDFIEWFKKQAHYKNSVLIITGDHGRDLGLHDKLYVDPYKFRIPVLILGGAVNAAYENKEVNTISSQVSIMPFVLQEMGLPVNDFDFYNHPINATTNYAFYTYNGGFAWLQDSAVGLFYSPPMGIKNDVEKKLNKQEASIYHAGRAFEQYVMKKYFGFNQ